MSILNSICEGAVKLPSLPAIAVKILQIIRDDRSSLDDLSQAIAYDPALTAKLLSMSNSSFYALPYKVDSIDRAVSVLGMDALKNTTLSFALVKGMRRDRDNGFDYEFFWRRAITSAVSAEMIAARSGREDKEAFLTALLMDIGIMVMHSCKPQEYQEVIDEKRVSGGPLKEAEQRHFGYDHQRVGSELLEKWEIPESIFAPIAYHHETADVPSAVQQSAKVLLLADMTSSVYHGSRNIEKMKQLKQLLQDEFDFKGDEFDTFIDQVASKTMEVLEFFDIDQGNMKPYSQVLQEANEELEKLNLSYEHLVIELHQAKKRAETFAVELKNVNEQLRDLAYRDGLTGLFNHRYFQEMIDVEIQRAKRYEHSLSLIMVDIDHFKQINDTFGHPSGDEVLRFISEVLRKSIRACDIASRYGGEEFSILLPETDIQGAAILAERVRKEIENNPVRMLDQTVRVTASLGGTTFYPEKSEENKSLIISAADKALYNAKTEGRNRISLVTL